MARWDAPMMLFHQCMDTEWHGDPNKAVDVAGWGRSSAMEFAQRGFVVVRIRMEHWRDLLRRDPHAFRKPYASKDQSMICTIMMRDVTLPFISRMLEDIREGRLSADPTVWARSWPYDDSQMVMPTLAQDNSRIGWDVIAITEASAAPCDLCTPASLRSLDRQYVEPIIWAGFNADTRCTGSKLLLMRPTALQGSGAGSRPGTSTKCTRPSRAAASSRV